MKKFFVFIIGIQTLLLLWSGSASAGVGGLLGVQPGYPNISFAGSGASYNAPTGALSINSVPAVTIFVAGGAIENVTGAASLSISATISNTGMLSPGGTFTLTGTVTNTVTSATYTGTLLAGTVQDYGIQDVAATDFMDFRITPTGGSMLALIGSNNIGVFVTLEGSTFTGSLATSFSSITVKGNVGPTPASVPTGSGTGTIGYWKNHPEAWPVSSLTVGGTTLSKAQALSILGMPVKGDKTIAMAVQLIAAKLNVALGNDSSCIASTITAADAWLSIYGIGSGQKSWAGGDVLHDDLDAYNNGQLCAPARSS